MIKFIGLVRHRDGVARETLYGRWVTVHVPHIMGIAEPLRYVLTFFDPPPGGQEPQYDGMAEIWFRDRDHYETTMGRSAPPTLGADHFVEYFDTETYRQFLAEEHVIVDGPAAPPSRKLSAFVRRRPAVGADELRHCWLTEHAPNVAAAVQQTAGALRYVVSVAVDDGASFAGLAEISFADAAAAAAGLGPVAPDRFRDLIEPNDLLLLTGPELIMVEGS